MYILLTSLLRENDTRPRQVHFFVEHRYEFYEVYNFTKHIIYLHLEFDNTELIKDIILDYNVNLSLWILSI